VIRQRQIVRRFDTRIRAKVLPPTDAEAASWVNEQMLRRTEGEQVWEGGETDLAGVAPAGAPENVWAATLAFRSAFNDAPVEVSDGVANAGERRVLSRRVRLIRTPVTRIEYSFAGRGYEAFAVGRAGDERFWAETFPPRWNRVSRFFQAVAHDIAGEPRQRNPHEGHTLNGSVLRDRTHIRIIEEPSEESSDDVNAAMRPDEPGAHADDR
jgi:hypothetical protein